MEYSIKKYKKAYKRVSNKETIMCDNCKYEDKCRDEKLACNNFGYWISDKDQPTYSIKEYKNDNRATVIRDNRIPSRQIYDRIFGSD